MWQSHEDRKGCCFFFFFSEDGISLLKHVLLIENCNFFVNSSNHNQFSALTHVLWHMHQSNLIQLKSTQMAIWFHISSTSGPCVTDRRVNVLATLSKRHKNASSFFFSWAIFNKFSIENIVSKSPKDPT